MGLDPVTFEVLKNSFVTVVDEMAEQILRSELMKAADADRNDIRYWTRRTQLHDA